MNDMLPDRKLLDQLKENDAAEHSAYSRVLCEKILKDSPDHPSTLIRYARTLIEFALYSEAGTVLDHATRVVPESRMKWVLAHRGHLLEHMGDFTGAEERHLEAHALDPDDATFLIYAGTVAFRRGEIRRAEQLARQATECQEGCVDEAFFNLGGCLLAQKRYTEARDCYLKALELDPDYSLAKAKLLDVELVLKSLADKCAE